MHMYDLTKNQILFLKYNFSSLTKGASLTLFMCSSELTDLLV